jgi:hypothetical protein
MPAVMQMLRGTFGPDDRERYQHGVMALVGDGIRR